MKRNNNRKARMEQSRRPKKNPLKACLLYTSDAADDTASV